MIVISLYYSFILAQLNSNESFKYYTLFSRCLKNIEQKKKQKKKGILIQRKIIIEV